MEENRNIRNCELDFARFGLLPRGVQRNTMPDTLCDPSIYVQQFVIPFVNSFFPFVLLCMHADVAQVCEFICLCSS